LGRARGSRVGPALPPVSRDRRIPDPDAGGTLLYASKGRVEGENFRDRSYFKAFANVAVDCFSEVQNDPLSGRPVLNIAAPARNDAGALLGVVVAQVDLTYLAQCFDSVGVGASGVVSLRRVEDGSLILRRPFVPDLVNRPLINHPLQQQLDAGVPVPCACVPRWMVLNGFTGSGA
jgi:hypothetical protein